MRNSIGLICSVLGAAAATYLAIIAVVTLPAAGIARWLAVMGVVALSLLVGLIINGSSIESFLRLSRELRNTSDLYNTLTSRLSPLLYAGIEDVLERRTKELELLSGLKFNAAAPIKGLYRVVASTYPREAPIRQVELEPDEGFVGFIASQKVAGFTRTVDADQEEVFDCSGKVIGKRGMIREVNKGKMGLAGRWLYARPIFERSVATPWSNRVVGVLLAHSVSDDGDTLFTNVDFQLQVDSLASDVAPYLDVIQTLLAEGKV